MKVISNISQALSEEVRPRHKPLTIEIKSTNGNGHLRYAFHIFMVDRFAAPEKAVWWVTFKRSLYILQSVLYNQPRLLSQSRGHTPLVDCLS